MQFEIVRLLREVSNDVFIVGDDDQSIYCFRGAKPEFLLQFNKYFENVKDVTLDTNYRSVPAVVEYSNRLILHNKNRFNKQMKAHQNGAEVPKILECEDGAAQVSVVIEKMNDYLKKGVSPQEIAIIYRNNTQARPFVETLLNSGIPCKIRDNMHTLYNHWICKDIISYLKLAENLSDFVSIERVINRPKRYISRDMLKMVRDAKSPLMEIVKNDQLSDWKKEPIEKMIYDLQVLQGKKLPEAIEYIKNSIGYVEYLNNYATYRKIAVENLLEVLNDVQDSAKRFDNYMQWEDSLKEVAEGLAKNNNKITNAVTLTTMHSSKGLEFEVVFVIDAVVGVVFIECGARGARPIAHRGVLMFVNIVVI